MKRVAEMEKLIANVNPKAEIPLGFGLWSKILQRMWLRANQKPAPRKGRKP